MKNKQLAISVIGLLIASNVITGWHYKNKIDTRDFEFEQVTNNLHSLNEQYDEKISQYQSDINELNYNMDLKDKKIVDLSQQLEEIKARNEGKNSP